MSSAAAVSTYSVAHGATFYGNHQEDYQRRSEAAVAEMVTDIKAGQKRDLNALFYRILDKAGKMRNQIAVDHNTNYAELYGVRRDVKLGGPAMYTGVYGQYEEYNQRMLAAFHAHLCHMKHDLKEFQEKTYQIEDTWNGMKSSFEFHIYDTHDLRALRWDQPLGFEKEFSHLVSANKVTPLSGEPLRQLKSKRPELYKREVMCFCLKNIYDAFPSSKKKADGQIEEDTTQLKSHWVVAIPRLEIEGRMVALSQLVTWMYTNHREDPVDRMKRCSHVTVIHQDTFLIDYSLQAIAKIFEKIICWNGQDRSELKKLVGLFRYLFAYAMPFCRGSAAVGEWFETALYRYHGFNFSQTSKKMMDFEAFSSIFLSKFMKQYLSTVHI